MDKRIVYVRKDEDIPEYKGEFNSPSLKEREAHFKRQIGDKAMKEGLLDSDWLMEKYPDRFKGQYLRKDLLDDQYEPALYRDPTKDENI